MGDGLPPVPAKLAKKIQGGEFVDMHELLPELWSSVRDEEGAPRTSRVRAKKWVQDIHVWMQCYAVYVSVRSLKSPSLVPELMAYMVGILRASMEYEGIAWTTYDAAFRRQAAATGHTQWSKVNPSLYTICFTGRAKRMGRCELCLSSAHRHDECPLVADEDPDIGRRMKAVESAVVAFSAGGQGPQHQQKAREICMLFNDRHCKFRNCKYRHVCRLCEGWHPAVECTKEAKRGAQPTRGPFRREPSARSGGFANPY